MGGAPREGRSAFGGAQREKYIRVRWQGARGKDLGCDAGDGVTDPHGSNMEEAACLRQVNAPETTLVDLTISCCRSNYFVKNVPTYEPTDL